MPCAKPQFRLPNGYPARGLVPNEMLGRVPTRYRRFHRQRNQTAHHFVQGDGNLGLPPPADEVCRQSTETGDSVKSRHRSRDLVVHAICQGPRLACDRHFKIPKQSLIS